MGALGSARDRDGKQTHDSDGLILSSYLGALPVPHASSLTSWSAFESLGQCVLSVACQLISSDLGQVAHLLEPQFSHSKSGDFSQVL